MKKCVVDLLCVNAVHTGMSSASSSELGHRVWIKKSTQSGQEQLKGIILPGMMETPGLQKNYEMLKNYIGRLENLQIIESMSASLITVCH